MLEKSALDRLGNVDAGMISDCMMRLGLAGWMDGVRPIQSGHRRAAGRARTLLFGPKRGEGQWSRSMYRTIASLQPGLLQQDLIELVAGRLQMPESLVNQTLRGRTMPPRNGNRPSD